MATSTIETFSISAAAVLSPTGTQAAQLYGCKEGRIEMDVTTSDLRSDDWYVGTWNNAKSVSLAINAGFISFSALAFITGNTVTSSAGAPDNYYATPLWTAYGANTRPVPVALRCPARDSTGSPGTLDLILFQVQLYGIEPAGIQYKQGLTASFNGIATLSFHDDLGNTLPDRAFGRIVAWANAKTSFTGTVGTVYRIGDTDQATTTELVKTSGAPTFRVILSSSDTARGSPETERLQRSAITPGPETSTAAEPAPVVGVTDTEVSSAAETGAVSPQSVARAALSGAGAVIATPRAMMAGRVTTVGYGQVSAHAISVPSGAAQLSGSASLSGTGTLTATPRPTYSALMTGTGQVSAAPISQTRPAAMIAGTGTLAAVYAGSGVAQIVTDPTTPPVGRSTSNAGGAVTSSYFSPDPGGLVYVAIVWMWASTSTPDAITVFDSLGNTYAQVVALPISGAGQDVSLAICRFAYTTPPGSINITAVNSVTTTASVDMAVRVLNNCALSQASAATAVDLTDGAITVSTTQDYSWVLSACGNNGNSTGGPAASSIMIDFWSDSSTTCDAGVARVATQLHGPVACGFSNMTRGVACEILHT